MRTERAGGIVDRNQIGGMRCQGFQPVQDRLLPAGATRHRRRKIQALDGGPIVAFVAGGDDDLDTVDPRCRLEYLQGTAQDRPARQRGILFGQGASEAAPPASGDDQGGAGWHGRLDNIDPTAAHSGPLAHPARTRYCSPNYCALHKMPII